MAVVGGSNVMLRPEYPMGMCKGHFLSRDGECKSFDARGDGYGRGEGAGIVLLKPLEDALRDGDPILATVLATGSNQDGHTPGISMPSREAQQALIEEVCQDYDIDPACIRYVECHGTGTAIGDPTETKAIGAVYGNAAGRGSALGRPDQTHVRDRVAVGEPRELRVFALVGANLQRRWSHGWQSRSTDSRSTDSRSTDRWSTDAQVGRVQVATGEQS